MQKSETYTIVLEGEEERARLTTALYNHYQWLRHEGSGEMSAGASALFDLFRSLSGCHSIQEYEATRKLQLDHLVRNCHKIGAETPSFGAAEHDA